MTKEDIESIDWIYNSKSIDLWFYKEGIFDMGSWTAYKIIMHYGLHDNRMHVYADDPGMDNYDLFRGVIKTKEEFIILEKQLEIYEKN